MLKKNSPGVKKCGPFSRLRGGRRTISPPVKLFLEKTRRICYSYLIPFSISISFSLKGEDIPELARIIGVADAYDAMTSKRSYRDPMPQERVREEIVKGSGKQFDPQFAEIMLHQIDLDTDYTMKES